MLVTQKKFNTHRKNGPKFGKKISTELIDDAKTSLKIQNGLIQLQNSDSVSIVLGNNQYVITKSIQSPDNLLHQTTMKIKKRLFGGFKVVSAELAALHGPHTHKNGIGDVLVIKSLGKVDKKTATEELQEALGRVLKEDIGFQAVKICRTALAEIKKLR